MIRAADEFESSDLRDQRLNRRVVLLAAQPTASMPAASGAWVGNQVFCRLLSEDEIGWAGPLAGHRRANAWRCSLCIQDTTELDFNGQGIEGLVLLSYEAQAGMVQHPTYALTRRASRWACSMHGWGPANPGGKTARAAALPGVSTRGAPASLVRAGRDQGRSRAGLPTTGNPCLLINFMQGKSNASALV